MSLSFQNCPHIGSQNPNIQISIVVNGQLLVISCKRISPWTQSDPFPIKYKVKTRHWIIYLQLYYNC